MIAQKKLTDLPVVKRLLTIDPANARHAPDAVTALALLYIALPNLIFIVGWLRPAVALPLLALTVAGLIQFLRRTDMSWTLPQSTAATMVVVAAAFVWASLGGAGHFFYANPDWLTRDKVLGDLTLSAWPPAYDIVDGHAHILRSAIGFFLPAAMIGKLTGIGSVDLTLYVYTALGAALFLLSLPLPHKPGRLLAGLLLISLFFSGMDSLGILIISGSPPIFPLRLEWWVPFSYTSLTGQLFWAPNHAIPLWLVATLFYRHWGHRCWPALFLVLLPLTVIWTPFAVAALIPFLTLATLRWFALGYSVTESGITRWQVLSALMLSWLTLRLMTLDIAAIPNLPSAQVAPDTDRFLTTFTLFVLMEFAILALLLARGLRHSHGLFWLAFTILALLPLYKFGPSNDTMLRLSTPCLIFLLLITLDRTQYWVGQRKFPPNAWAISIVLLIGAGTPFNEIWRALFFKSTPPNYARSLVEEHWNTEPPHYIGRLDRSDLIAVLRKPAIVPKAVERRAQELATPVPVALE